MNDGKNGRSKPFKDIPPYTITITAAKSCPSNLYLGFKSYISSKKPVIKIGAEIPFTRFFYEYQEPEKSEDLLKKFEDVSQGEFANDRMMLS